MMLREVMDRERQRVTALRKQAEREYEVRLSHLRRVLDRADLEYGRDGALNGREVADVALAVQTASDLAQGYVRQEREVGRLYLSLDARSDDGDAAETHIADLIDKLHDALVDEYGSDFAYTMLAEGAILAASNVTHGLVKPTTAQGLEAGEQVDQSGP